jgi:transcriptional regulator with XRE-family HTH domain
MRTRRGISQNELAEVIGYEQTYISALEVGKKGPPTPAFVDRLISAFDLPLEEQDRLRDALDASQRKLVIDGELPQNVFWMFRELRHRVSELTPEEIQLIRQVLALRDAFHKNDAEANQRQRLKRRIKTETRM